MSVRYCSYSRATRRIAAAARRDADTARRTGRGTWPLTFFYKGTRTGRRVGPRRSWGSTGSKALDAAGVTVIAGPFLDFRDPWGNRVEIVGYDSIEFTKAPNVLRGVGLTHLAKTERAKHELAEKGMTAVED